MFINFKIREVYKVKRPYKNHSFGQNYGVALLGKGAVSKYNKTYKQYEENSRWALEFKLLRRKYHVKKLRLFEA